MEEGPVRFSCRSDGLAEVGRGGYGDDFQLILLHHLQLDGAGSFADFEIDNGDLQSLRRTCEKEVKV